MGLQVIKQPDGQYAVFSSTSDTFCVVNATAREVVSFFGERARERAEEEAKKVVEDLEMGRKPYHQFTMTWKEALRKHREHKDNADDDFNRTVEEIPNG